MGKPAVAIGVRCCSSWQATPPLLACLLRCTLGFFDRSEDWQDEDVWSSALSARTVLDTQTLQLLKAEGREESKRKGNIWRFLSIVLWKFQSCIGVLIWFSSEYVFLKYWVFPVDENSNFLLTLLCCIFRVFHLEAGHLASVFLFWEKHWDIWIIQGGNYMHSANRCQKKKEA